MLRLPNYDLDGVVTFTITEYEPASREESLTALLGIAVHRSGLRSQQRVRSCLSAGAAGAPVTCSAAPGRRLMTRCGSLKVSFRV